MADRPLWGQRDPYGEKILASKFDWRDEHVLAWISNFVNFGLRDSRKNVQRQSAAVGARYNKNGKKRTYRSSGQLLRSIAWKTWSESGGDIQVFHAHYLYYEKFLELALGKGDPFNGLPPDIPGANWKPITVPGRTRKARPSIPTEMRREASKFITYVQDHFSYAGIAMMVYSISALQPHAKAVNRAMFLHGLSGRGLF